MFKACPQCGQQFKTYRSAAIYCGKRCQDAALIRRESYECAHCHKTFQRPNHAIKHAARMRFCSHDCHTAWKQANRRMATCVVCGVAFSARAETQRTCSKRCRDAALVTAVMLTCEHCGSEFRDFARSVVRGRRFCSNECAKDAMVGPAHPNYRSGKWLKHGRRWQAVRAAVIERDRVCQWCGVERSRSGRSLDVHHIKPRRDYEIVDVANEMPNLVALCASCHTRVEMLTTHGRTSEIPTRLVAPESALPSRASSD